MKVKVKGSRSIMEEEIERCCRYIEELLALELSPKDRETYKKLIAKYGGDPEKIKGDPEANSMIIVRVEKGLGVMDEVDETCLPHDLRPFFKAAAERLKKKGVVEVEE